MKVISFMEASHKIPNFILSKSNYEITSNTVSIALGLTRMKRVMGPYGSRQRPLCIHMVDFISTYSSLFNEFNHNISSVITFTWLVGSTRTLVTIFPLRQVGMYRGESLLFKGKSYEVNVTSSKPVIGYREGVTKTMLMYAEG